MAARKKPNHIDVAGDVYRATVFLINTKWPDGTPALCTLLPDDHTIDLAGGEEFMIAYVSRRMLTPKNAPPPSGPEEEPR